MSWTTPYCNVTYLEETKHHVSVVLSQSGRFAEAKILLHPWCSPAQFERIFLSSEHTNPVQVAKEWCEETLSRIEVDWRGKATLRT